MSLKLSIADAAASLIDCSLRSFRGELHRYVVQTMYSRLQRWWESDSLLNDLNIQMATPRYVQPDASDRQLVDRIFGAFRQAKHDQEQKDEVFMPSTYWQGFLDASYPSYRNTDIDQFHFFLSNFGAWESYLGINWTYLLRQYAGSPRSRRHFEKAVIGRKVGWWLRFESRGRDISALSQPRYGNQWGASVNGHFITYESVLNEFYGRMISNLVRQDRPVVGEIGAGYGVLFYFVARALSDFCYLDFDLPETLSCATYYLMKSFPGKKFLLYGEGNLDEDALREYDFVLMPSFAIEELPSNSVDMFINMSSLGEMKPSTGRVLVRQICRVSDAFWHMNHEYVRNAFEDGTSSLVNSEYPVPEEEFELVVRYIDALNAVWQGAFEPGYDIYGYYYARKRTTHSSRCHLASG